MPKTQIALDSQVLTNLMGCARLTNYAFNLNYHRKGGKSNSLEVGSLVHCILEFSNKALIDGKSRTDAIADGFAAGKEYIEQYKETNKYVLDKEHKGLTNTPESGDRYIIGINEVFSTMEQYFDYWKSDSWTVIAAEETRGEVIYSDDEMEILWKAKFDKISDTPYGFISTDYKTMKQRRDTLSLNNQFMGQCLLLKSRNVVVDKIGFQSSLKPEEKFLKVNIPYSMDRLIEQRDETIPHYARMLIAYSGAEYWPPNYTHCETKYGKCDFVGICEHDRNMRLEALGIDFEIGKAWDV